MVVWHWEPFTKTIWLSGWSLWYTASCQANRLHNLWPIPLLTCTPFHVTRWSSPHPTQRQTAGTFGGTPRLAPPPCGTSTREASWCTPSQTWKSDAGCARVRKFYKSKQHLMTSKHALLCPETLPYQFSFRSYPPMRKCSPPGWTAMEDTQRLFACTFFSILCFWRLYTLMWVWVCGRAHIRETLLIMSWFTFVLYHSVNQ